MAESSAPETSSRPPYKPQKIVEEALIAMDDFNSLPPEEVIGTLNSFLKAAGLANTEGTKWTEQTTSGVTAWLMQNHETISDPAVSRMAEIFISKHIGAGSIFELSPNGNPDGSTRGYNPAPEEPTIKDVEDCGAPILGGEAVKTHNCARNL